MNKAVHFLTFLEGKIRHIWKDERMQSRKTGMYFFFPLILTVLLLVCQRYLYRDLNSIPYVFLFIIILISASFGGGRCALFATLITFFSSFIYFFFGTSLDLVTLFLYLASGMFLTALLHFFLQQQRAQQLLLSKTNQTNEELLRLEKNHEDFVNMASHELKLPVTVLKAYIQMIALKREKPGFTESFMTITEKMDTQLDKLLNIISDLHDATKVNSGSLNCLMNKFNLNESLRNSVDGILVATPGVTVEFDLAYADPIINGDKDRIEQVITNFIGNALKYSGAEKYLKITSIINDGWAKVSIEDHGFGISIEKQPYVFERFFRVSTPKVNQLPGLGLGLFICKEIIDQHNGKIGVISEEGKGSEFWFCLPV